MNIFRICIFTYYTLVQVQLFLDIWYILEDIYCLYNKLTVNYILRYVIYLWEIQPTTYMKIRKFVFLQRI